MERTSRSKCNVICYYLSDSQMVGRDPFKSQEEVRDCLPEVPVVSMLILCLFDGSIEFLLLKTHE
jgi:hypothetical protein